MRVVFSRRSVVRLREIQAWIAYDNVTAAAQVVRRIRQRAELLADHPRLATVWRDGQAALWLSRIYPSVSCPLARA